VPVGGFVRLKQSFHTSGQLRRAFITAPFRAVEIHGVYLGPIHWLERLVPRALPAALRFWEPIDSLLADLALVREVSNMFLIKAERRS
jgi:hypothetical protein